MPLTAYLIAGLGAVFAVLTAVAGVRRGVPMLAWPAGLFLAIGLAGLNELLPCGCLALCSAVGALVGMAGTFYTLLSIVAPDGVEMRPPGAGEA